MRKGTKITASVTAGIAAIIVIAAVASAGGNKSETAPPPPQVTTSAPAAPHSTAPPEQKMTASQEQAVSSAKGYLEMGSGFSEKSLMDQLTSNSGEGFPEADAAFAIKYLHPDWNAQAVTAAKGYLDLGTGFSRSGLIEQLSSPSGDGFTHAQAVYAADQVGL